MSPDKSSIVESYLKFRVDFKADTSGRGARGPFNLFGIIQVFPSALLHADTVLFKFRQDFTVKAGAQP
jgi:hypothetical protein